jgi:hypothetical protein
MARRLIRDLASEIVSIVTPVLAILLTVWVVASPWILLIYGGWRMLLRSYLLPYPLVLLAFGLVMALFNRRELLARVRNWRAGRKSKLLMKAV